MSEPAEDTGRVVRWSLRVGDRVVAGLDVAIPPVRTAADAWNAAALVGDAIERTLLAQAGLWPSAAGPPDDVDENLREIRELEARLQALQEGGPRPHRLSLTERARR